VSSKVKYEEDERKMLLAAPAIQPKMILIDYNK
jgi:hypothetical protein